MDVFKIEKVLAQHARGLFLACSQGRYCGKKEGVFLLWYMAFF